MTISTSNVVWIIRCGMDTLACARKFTTSTSRVGGTLAKGHPKMRNYLSDTTKLWKRSAELNCGRPLKCTKM